MARVGKHVLAHDDAPLLERAEEIAALTEAISAASEGTGCLVLVEGPAGIGKTRLLQAATALAEEHGFLVRMARGGELECDIPFGIARQLFENLIERADTKERDRWLSGSARRALSVLGLSEDDEARHMSDPFAGINALYWLTSNVSGDRPVGLIVDDAQWADGPSLRFLIFLTRRLGDLPVTVFVGVRTGEAAEATELQTLRVEARSLKPTALSDESVHELIRRRVGREPPRDFSRACATATSGNPFLVMEILRELDSDPSLLDRATSGSIAQLAPENVARAVLMRVGRFGNDAIALARAIAILGRAPQLRHAARLAGLDEDAARVLADRLRGAEVLAPGLPIDFVHPLVRQAIHLEIPEGERSADHRRAAEILAVGGASSDEIAAHLLASQPNGDPWVVERLHEAALSAMEEGAYDSAVTYLDRALQEPPHDDLPLLQSLGSSLLMGTDVFRSQRVFQDLATRASDPDTRVTALRWLGVAHLWTGDLLGGAAILEEVITLLGDRDRELSLALEADLLFLRYAGAGEDPAAAERIEAVAASLAGGTWGERAARQALGIVRFIRGASEIHEVLDLILPAPDPPWEMGGVDMTVPFATPKVLAWCGRWDEARSQWQRALVLMEGEGKILPVSAVNSFLAEAERLAGRLRESESHARTALEIGQLPEGLSPFRWSAWLNLAATLIARGDVAGFEEVIGDFDLSAGPFEMPVNPWPLELRATYHRERGDLENAADDFVRLTEEMERFGRLNPSTPPHWRQEATEVLAALGRTAEAKQMISVAEERAVFFGAPHAIGLTLRARAAIEPRKPAIQTLERSVEILESSGPPHELARSLIALGAARRRAGDRADAREVLGRALELAHSSGAGGLEKRAREELAAAGARPRRVDRSGLGALTATEFRVARLAAEGLSNKEIAERLFVTVRTVETHLTHTYAKLGIEGRRDLARRLADELVAS